MDWKQKDRYTIDDLLQIMKILRSPEGCPWDREQDHRSIRNCMIEEACEAAEAIDTGDTDLLKEELGDVLLQVVFHSELEQEAGGFDFSDVVDGIAKKMIVRHPHVFGDAFVRNSDEVLVSWDAIKKRTKGQETQTDVLKSVSKALPALMRSAKVQGKVAKTGLDRADLAEMLQKVEEKTAELKQAVASDVQQDCGEALGDLLFSVVNVSRLLKTEPEQALSTSCEKFIARFQKAEQIAAARGTQLASLSPEELDLLWNGAKAK